MVYRKSSWNSGEDVVHSTQIQRNYVWLEGELVALVYNDELYFVHNDHLGRSHKMTNDANYKGTKMRYRSVKNGAPDRSRTCDLCLRRAALVKTHEALNLSRKFSVAYHGNSSPLLWRKQPVLASVSSSMRSTKREAASSALMSPRLLTMSV